MCWFKKKPVIVIPPEPDPVEPEPEPEPEVPPTPVIPHPEEPKNPLCTMENYNLDLVFGKWFEDWQVPVEWRDYWRNAIEVEVTDTISYPAGTWHNGLTGKRHLVIRPDYLNAGVIAHENCHNSYALLTEQQKLEFSAAYTPLKTSDPLIVYLYSINCYGTSDDIEGMAELYRYLGDQMPDELKQFYPRLM
jgi:hypothetical protein